MPAKPQRSKASKAAVMGHEAPPNQPAAMPPPLPLSDEQYNTIRKYAQLPASLAKRLAAKNAPLTLDELDDLLDYVEWSVYRAKGNERQKVQRIAAKLAKFLGSTIRVEDMPKERPPKADTIFQIKITVEGIDPPIWRRVQTRDCTLAGLHVLIQVAMGWEDDHPYRFTAGGIAFMPGEAIRDSDSVDDSTVRLSEVLPPQNRRPRFSYQYDFGDDWRHQLIVEERLPPEAGATYPRCAAGARACPPEDCGGIYGYYRILKCLQDPTVENADYGWQARDFDPERFDLAAVNQRLRRLRI